MKKFLLIALIGLFTQIKSQAYPPSGTVTLVNTVPKQACIGDSVELNFKFYYSGNPDTIVKWFFHIWVPPFSFHLVWNTPYYNFFNLPQAGVGPDIIYTYKFLVKPTYPTGPVSLCINSQLSCLNLIIVECTHEGIDEYGLDGKLRYIMILWVTG